MGDTSLSAMASCEYTVTESFFRSIRSCSTYIYISHLVVTFLGCQKDQIQIISNSQYMLFLLDLWKMSVFLCYHLSLCFLNKDSFPPLDGGVKCSFGVRVESAAFRSP